LPSWIATLPSVSLCQCQNRGANATHPHIPDCQSTSPFFIFKYIDVNYLHNGILHSLDQKIEKNSESLGRSAVYSKTQRISRLPAYLTVNFVRFFWKENERVKAKILRKVKFPFELDASQFCTPDLQAKLTNTKLKLRELDNAETALKRRHRLDKESGRMETDEVSEEQKAVQAAQDALEGSLDPELVKDVGCNPSGQYELAAVLTHIGRTADSGHYIGWARKGNTDDWYKYDDDKVSPVSKDDILKLDGGGNIIVLKDEQGKTVGYFITFHYLLLITFLVAVE